MSAGPTVQGALSVWTQQELFVNVPETFYRRDEILFPLWLVNMLYHLVCIFYEKPLT